MKKIETIEQFEEIVEKNSPVFILKHSLTCPISQAAYDEYEKFSLENETIATYFIAIQEARPLSNYIAEKYHIKHESPQAILFSDEQPVWNDSHRQITDVSLTKALQF
ncbi:bacillithiol system redox-active protein YtxJ [Bacillus sp. 03113]|uniref:bacillithiol system redox-active protein YtxJ n=1 Tax=Bacillus sp. 03113 TaxID=2578211 RepID=UPI0015E8D9FF|nr:bacillithiol system redox-active protein YtxJ [Bacillus sp. 03113]